MNNPTHPHPELLAPAGDWDALRAAVANGADSVYFGLDQFNARHRATNFTLEELPKVIDYLHSHNVKGFITFNILIFSDELPAAIDYLKAIAQAGVDAVIVQDLGIASIIHQLAPTLAIHASTQMTLTEPWGIEFVRQLGIRRVVLAHELGLQEIAKITAQTTMPVEVFIHGALCVSYSGQCLTSESLGGRSANRGQCAQACRLPYDLIVDGKVKDLGDKAYLLSPSDLAAYDLIGDLTNLGVASFKIEGRLKSAHYVAATCQTYRAAIDSAISNLKSETSETSNFKSEISNPKFQISDSQRHDLEQTFSRGFTHGFLSGVNHQQLVSARFPKARGTKIGTVIAKTARGVIVQTETRSHQDTKGHEVAGLLKAGDGIVFDEGHPEQDEQGGRVFAVKSRTTNHDTRTTTLELEFRSVDINLAYINPGALVWKTDDPAIKRRLEHSYSRDEIVHRTPIEFAVRAHVGEHLQIIAHADGHEARARWGEKPLEPATKFPITQATARDQLSRLGDTPYELATVTLNTDNQAMVPKSILNDLRRKLVEDLLHQRQPKIEITTRDILAERRASLSDFRLHTSDFSPHLYVLTRTLDQVEATLAHTGPLRPSMIYVEFEDVRRYPEAIARCRAAPGGGMPVALSTIRIVKPGEQGFLKQVSDCNPDALLVRSLAAMGYYREKAPHLPLIADYSLNIANELTADIFSKSGVIRMVPSYDLNWTQLASMVRRFDASKFETVIHQHMPMFHMEHCVFAHTLSTGTTFKDCGRPCDRHKVDLKDRMSQTHPLIPDVGCRNTLYNAQAQTAAEYIPQMKELGLHHFRVELLRENPEETTRILDRYTRLLTGAEKPLETLRSLRVLNQLGVTRGTLVHE